MFAVIFEVTPKAEGKAAYLQIAAGLRTHLERQEGFLSIERFQSLADEKKILSLSFWSDEAAIDRWRRHLAHRAGQEKGKSALFDAYRIRVARVMREYTESDRTEAPADSKGSRKN